MKISLERPIGAFALTGGAGSIRGYKKAEQSFLVGSDLSDFLVWRKDGVAAYELATVVDDYLMQITEVVRGEDLLVSSARQCLLWDTLGWVRPIFTTANYCLAKMARNYQNQPDHYPAYFRVLEIALAFAKERNSYWACSLAKT